MSSVEENQCIDPSLAVPDYAEALPPEEETVSPAYSGAQCTPDTYVDASDFTPVKPADKKPDTYATASSPPAALGALCILCGCAPVNPRANPHGDGGFDFGEGEGEGESESEGEIENDADRDGYPEDKDCDDTDASIHPRAEEEPYDGIDQDCNGEDVIDADNDGFIATQAGGDDCNDDQAYIHPDTDASPATQRLTDFDTNCDGTLEIDLDRDSIKFVGENDGDQFGRSMALGDVNGDGYADVIVATSQVSVVPEDGSGKAYIFFGGEGRFLPGTTLNAADADVQINGRCGWALGGHVSAKDLDGDGMAEVLIGVSGFNSAYCEGSEYHAGDSSQSGAIFVFQGRESWDSTYDFYDIDAWDETQLAEHQIGIIKGPNNRRLGGKILVTGDIDGDGVGQIVAGRQNQCDVIPARVYEGINRIDEVRDSEGGYRIHNSTGTPFNGNHCDSLVSGDFNDDGLADLALANTADEPHDGAGEVAVLLGGEEWPADMNLASLENYAGLNHLFFVGNGAAYGAGGSLSAGKVAGVGGDDLFIGVDGEDSPYENAGAVYCIPSASIAGIFAGEKPPFGNGDRLVLDGDVYDVGGRSFRGDIEEATVPSFGLSATSDTNGDGVKDIVIGAGFYGSEADGTGLGGQTFFFDGSSTMLSEEPEVSVSEATQRASGSGIENFGLRVAGEGDVNADGTEDVLVGASGTPSSNLRGSAYLLLGGSR